MYVFLHIYITLPYGKVPPVKVTINLPHKPESPGLLPM